MSGLPIPQFGPTGSFGSTIPSGAMVCSLVRRILGDTEVAGGQIFKNAFLTGTSSTDLGPYVSSYQWLIERMSAMQDRRMRRMAYGALNPYINYVNPTTIGLFTLGNPIDIWARPIQSVYGVQSASAQLAANGVDPYIELGVDHQGAIKDGQTVEACLLQGFTDDVNDSWTVTVPDTTHIRLMGATPAGSWIPSSGVIIVGNGAWPRAPVPRAWDLIEINLNSLASTGNLGAWMWENGAFRFPPSSVPAELRIVYDLAASPPTDLSAGIGIADSLNVLAHRTAWLAGRSKGWTLGDPAELKDDAERFLQEFLQRSAQDLQRERIILPRFRPKRNTGYQNLY